MIAKPPDPEERVHCSCGWCGQVKDAFCQVNSLVRCPECGEPVEKEEAE